MPITDLGSYVTTGQQFLAHWTDVDADRVAHTLPALQLTGNYDLADFTTELSDVEDLLAEFEDLDNGYELAAGVRDMQRTAIRERIMDLREAVKYRMKGSQYVGALPDTPHISAAEQKLIKSLEDMESLWVRINAESHVPGFTAPLILRGGYTLAMFQTEFAELKTTFMNVTHAENDLHLVRGRRDQALDAFRDRMVTYRQAIKVEYGEDHVFAQTLPDVYEQSSPPGGGGEVPVAPGVPTLMALDTNSILAQWTAVPLATYYTVQKLVVGQDLEFEDKGNVSTVFATIVDLPPGEVVQVRLKAGNNTGISQPGPHAEINLPGPP